MMTHMHRIGGRPVASDDVITVVNPSDGLALGRIARGGAREVDQAVHAAQSAMQDGWGDMEAVDRGRILARLAELIRRDAESLAATESLDVGKPMSLARGDVAACARYFEYYAGAADKLHGETIPYRSGHTVLTVYEPHGVVGVIVPWNYPLQMTGRAVAPALAMGNAVVLKPAEDTSLTALALADLAREAGLPDGALNVVTGYGTEAGDALIHHSGIMHISFTGSPEVGRLVQQAASERTIPVTLELGGKSPQIVFDDADMELAGNTILKAIVQNAGQTCSAGSRMIVEDAAYDRVVSDMARRFAAVRVGPGDQDLDSGPVVNARQMERVKGYIDLARRDGLPVLAQGQIVANASDGGYFVPPTLIGEVPPDHPLAQQEIFGPVLVAIRAKDEADALRIANATDYGLAAGIWTSDLGRALRIARSIDSGQVFINNYGAGGGIELPFGGVKASGFGREKGFAALYGFATLKTITIQHGA